MLLIKAFAPTPSAAPRMVLVALEEGLAGLTTVDVTGLVVGVVTVGFGAIVVGFGVVTVGLVVTLGFKVEVADGAFVPVTDAAEALSSIANPMLAAPGRITLPSLGLMK